MPVTARLSKLFYGRLGEAVANELVDWFDQVDATYRSDLREINELNFARFEARVEQRFAESEAKLERRFAQLEARFAQVDAKIDLGLERTNSRIDAALLKQTRFFFVAWASLLVPIIGLWFR